MSLRSPLLRAPLAAILSACLLLFATACGAEPKQAGEESTSGESATAESATSESVTTESGLIISELTIGTGASPTATSTVTVHYTGRFTNGKVFDSSVERGEPSSFPLNRVIKCWTEALQRMKIGGKAKLVCPARIAYGMKGRPPKIPGNATLHFEVELLGIE
jgi:FKBP-type peptidyl-prolyl cis-trans isomerase